MNRSTQAGPARRGRRDGVERVSQTLHAGMWVAAALVVAYLVDLAGTLRYNDKVDRTWLNLGLVCVGVFTMITLYLAVYLPYIARINLEWEVYCPRVIPAAAVVGLCIALCFNMALWPVYGFFTPAILGLLFMGGIMSFHFVPSF